MELSKEEKIRYARHLSLPEVGVEGQEKIKRARVLVIGAGGLGSPALLYLAAAGIGTVGIVDFDVIEESNLQRQVLYSTHNQGKRKAEYAKNRILELNPNMDVVLYQEKLTSENALKIIGDYDIVVDGSDNFPTRYLVNDACLKLDKPNVYGAIHQFTGQASVFNFENGPCYRCLFPNPPSEEDAPNCAEAGVLGVLPGVIGTIQATEALKIILGKGDVLSSRLLTYDALSMKFDELAIKKNSKCEVCSRTKDEIKLIDYELFCSGHDKSINDNEKMLNTSGDITVQELKKMIDEGKEFVLVDAREQFEQDLGMIQNAIPVSFVQTINGSLGSFDKIGPDKEIIIYCHTGQRSKHLVQFLKGKGFRNLKNVLGGIDAWSKEIDPSMPVY